MESMGLERLDRPTSLALRTLQDLIMLKKTTADMSFVPALVYAGEFGPALAVGLLGSALKKLLLFYLSQLRQFVGIILQLCQNEYVQFVKFHQQFEF